MAPRALAKVVRLTTVRSARICGILRGMQAINYPGSQIVNCIVAQASKPDIVYRTDYCTW